MLQQLAQIQSELYMPLTWWHAVANLARYMGCCNGFDAVHDSKSFEMSEMSQKAGMVTATVPKYALIYNSLFLAWEDDGCIA